MNGENVSSLQTRVQACAHWRAVLMSVDVCVCPSGLNLRLASNASGKDEWKNSFVMEVVVGDTVLGKAKHHVRGTPMHTTLPPHPLTIKLHG